MFVRKLARFGAVAMALGAVVTMAGCAGGGSAPTDSSGASDSDAIAELEPMKLIVSEPLPPNNSSNVGAKEWMDYITEHTNGKITFDVYDSATLHPMAEALSAIESGLSDITLYIPGLFSTDVPAGTWASGLGAYTGTSPMEMMAGSVAADAAFRTTDGISQELAAHNSILVGNWASDSYTLLCTEPVETLADAQGKLARSTGGVYNAEAEALGMTPVLMDAQEVYEGLQRGAINCQIGALQTFVNDSLAEVAKYYTNLPFSPNTGAGWIMNKEKYDALPDGVKKVFADAAPFWGIGNNQEVLKRYEEWYTTAEDDFDLTFVTADEKLRSTLADFRTSQGDTLVDRAPASVSDPQGVIDEFKDVYADWVQILGDEFDLQETDGTTEANLAVYQHLNSDFDWDGYRQRWADYVADLD